MKSRDHDIRNAVFGEAPRRLSRSQRSVSGVLVGLLVLDILLIGTPILAATRREGGAGEFQKHRAAFVSTGLESNAKEYRVKAAFLYRFCYFVKWPRRKLSEKKAITIGVVGKNPFGKSLAWLQKQKPVRGLKVKVRTFEKVADVDGCEVLFVSRTIPRNQLTTLVKKARKESLLLVGDRPDLLTNGGHLNFVIVDGKVKFEANHKETRQCGLIVSSKLLQLRHKRKKPGKSPPKKK